MHNSWQTEMTFRSTRNHRTVTKNRTILFQNFQFSGRMQFFLLVWPSKWNQFLQRDANNGAHLFNNVFDR